MKLWSQKKLFTEYGWVYELLVLNGKMYFTKYRCDGGCWSDEYGILYTVKEWIDGRWRY